MVTGRTIWTSWPDLPSNQVRPAQLSGPENFFYIYLL